MLHVLPLLRVTSKRVDTWRAVLRDGLAREPEGRERGRELSKFPPEPRRYAVPPPAPEAPEIDAVAEKAIEPGRRDDPGHVAIAEPKLEVGRAHARRESDLRLRAAVVEGTEERQHLWIRDGDAALAVADAEIPGPEVLRRRRGGEDQPSRHEQQPE